MKPAFLAAAILVPLCAGSTHAGITYPSALLFNPGYAIGQPAGFPVHDVPPTVGGPLQIIGTVYAVNAPFDDLLPAGPYEMTYVYAGATCVGWGFWDNIPCSGGIYGYFTGGTLSVYLDPTPDADFSNSATFTDGELVLQADINGISLLDDDPYIACPPAGDSPDMTMSFRFTGGAWFYRVVTDGIGYPGTGHGELDDTVPPDLQAAGFTFRVDGNLDVFEQIAVRPSTWGYVKSLYR